jgi:hypothetical protein
VTPAGVVTTVGGQVGIMGTNDGTGTNALFNQQEGVAVDKSGNIYVSDTQSDTIRIGIAPGPVLLGIAQSGGKAVLNWTDTAFSLQSASTAGGSYSNVTTAISPYTNSMSGPQQFFRLKAN